MSWQIGRRPPLSGAVLESEGRCETGGQILRASSPGDVVRFPEQRLQVPRSETGHGGRLLGFAPPVLLGDEDMS